ncbi:acyltransferase [Streptomyces sp. NPDC052020]|uniref:acyltransferase family protein n=1 Tax=Streptomyces sp. NPDC052020 TaxID=3155677 RepID=UPI003414ED8E
MTGSRRKPGPGEGTAPPDAPTTAPRALPALTGLRFPCALAVFLSHLAYLGDLYQDRRAELATAGLALLGPMGVCCFFIISGFVLTWSARPQDTASRFWLRRAARIYPAHIAVWCAMTAWIAAAAVSVPASPQGPGVHWAPAVANLFLLHTWVPHGTYLVGVNTVTWSLATEVFFYLLFPWLLPRVARIRPTRLWAAAGACVASAWLIPAGSLLLQGAPIVQEGEAPPLEQMWLFYFLPPARLPEFVLGMILARLVRQGNGVPLGPAVWGAALPVSLVLGAAVLPAPFLGAAVPMVPAAALVMATARADITARRCVLRAPRLVFLGEASYAFYLVHWPLIFSAHWLLGTPQWPAYRVLGLVLLLFGLAVAVAALLHVGLEQPVVRRLAGGRAGHRRTPSARRSPG